MSAAADRDRVRAVFDAVCDLPAEERRAYLDRACADEPATRTEVESLLNFDAASTGAFSEARMHHERGIVDPAETQVQDAPPESIGGYRIIRRIGGGGMGDVFEAQQPHPLRRVALKIMHRGGSSDIARRMRREGQIQASLNHPGIVQLIESGVDSTSGRLVPYCVMELVEGEPITAACAKVGLGVRECVELMVRVCDAVGHAHQRGVIHRDLKPDNIMVVTSTAGELTPKILDFGIAKLTQAASDAATIATQDGHIVGTLAYMSPEQASGGTGNIDTRTDVYALGLVLYEMLCGRPARQTAGLSLPAAARLVAESDPPRPGALRPEVRGDLESIIGKALEREKDRRYTSVSEFGSDLRRFLRNEPITAHPASATYLARKFIARNRALSAVAGAAVVLLAISSVITGVFAVSRDRASALATSKAAEALEAKRDAESVSTFLESMLASVAPAVALGQDTAMLRGVLDRAAARSEAELREQPLVLARLRTTIGATYRELGEFQSAETALVAALHARRELLGPNSPETLQTAHDVAILYQGQSRFPEALDLARDTLSRRERVLGPEHPGTLESAALVGSVMFSREMPECVPVLRDSAARMERALGRSDERTITTLTTLAAAIEDEQKLTEALTLKLDILARCEATLGADHPLTMTSINNLGVLYEKLGRHGEAEAQHLRAYEARRRVLGDAHPQTLSSAVNLALQFTRHGQAERALPLAQHALDTSQRTLSAGHHRIGHALRVLGLTLGALGRFEDADNALREAHAIFTANVGEHGPRTLQIASQLADLHEDWEAHTPGQGHSASAAEWRRRSTPPEPTQTPKAEPATEIEVRRASGGSR